MEGYDSPIKRPKPLVCHWRRSAERLTRLSRRGSSILFIGADRLKGIVVSTLSVIGGLPGGQPSSSLRVGHDPKHGRAIAAQGGRVELHVTLSFLRVESTYLNATESLKMGVPTKPLAKMIVGALSFLRVSINF